MRTSRGAQRRVVGTRDEDLLMDETKCYLCSRTIALGVDEWRVVTVCSGSAIICGTCIERGEESIEVPLTYEEQAGDD